MKRPVRVVIVGRPNVGKSTLFNRITRQRRSLVHPEPGVTRDVQRGDAEWTGVSFELVDTGGLFSGIEDALIAEVENRALKEAFEADAMIFVTDGQTGVTPADRDIADWVRMAKVPVFLAVNKTEKEVHRQASGEFYALGADMVYAISALHGQGVGDLLDAVVEVLPRRLADSSVPELRLALVGRPNVGKSSLVNRMIGAESNIVDSRPGTTRDSLDLSVLWHGHRVTLVDTAGIRRRSRSRDGLTSLTALKSIDSINRSDVVAVVLDASEEIANQDVKVASYAHKAAKGLFFCVNKWDLIEDKTTGTAGEYEKRIRRMFRFAAYAPILFTSALSGQRVSKIFDIAWDILGARRKRLATHEVNTFVEKIVASNPPPFHGGGNGKIYYMTQVDVAPPTFACFVNRRGFFGRSYLRFLNNKLREQYGFAGTPIRIKLVEKTREERSA